jgi:predicted nuclease of predicted toxin-antitoxin system
MADIRFLADMNISPRTIEALRQQGWDIVRVSQVMPVDATDRDVLDTRSQIRNLQRETLNPKSEIPTKSQ